MNKYLTPAMRRFLTSLRDGEDGYCLQERGQVWVDYDKFSAQTVDRCLRLCLISVDSYSSHGTDVWVLNEDGRKCLADPKYVPPALTLLK